MAGLTINNILAQKHRLMDFDGAWRATFGTPSAVGVWTIQGRSGSGKTTFALMLTQYLQKVQKRRIIYWSIEQCGDYGFQSAVRRAGLATGGVKFFGNDPDAMEQVITEMERRYGYNVLIIDTLTALHYNRERGFSQRDFNAFAKRLQDKLIVFVCHEKEGSNGAIETPAGDYIKQQANVKITVVGFVAYANARAGFVNGGGEPFVINQKLADEYSLNNL